MTLHRAPATATSCSKALLIPGFVRGLSVRDVDGALTEALGEHATVSKLTVSRVCEQINGEFETWSGPPARRRVAGLPVPGRLALQVPRQRRRLSRAGHPGHRHRRRAGVHRHRRAAAESGDAWAGFLTDLWERGLACPLLVISDGAPGLIGAVERTMGAGAASALRDPPGPQRVRENPDQRAGLGQGRLLGHLRRARHDRARPRRRRLRPDPPRLLCRPLARLLPGCGALPARRPRQPDGLPGCGDSTFIERTFSETCRRVKVIGRLPGEHSCLSLVWAVLDRASTGWRGFTMTAAGLRLLQDLRRSLLEPPAELRARDNNKIAPPDSVGAVA